MPSTTPQPIPPTEQLYTVGEVATQLALSRSKLYGMMDAGQLPYIKLGRSRRIHWSDVARLIERSRVGGDES
jgi:excisionase family DNA binding protein